MVPAHSDILVRNIAQESKRFSLKIKRNFQRKQEGFSNGLTYSTTLKSKVKREMLLPLLSPIPSNVELRDGMGLRMGKGISPCLFAFQEVESERPSLNPFN